MRIDRPAATRLVVIALLLALVCWLPFGLDSHRTFQLTMIAVWAVVAIGLNILTGYNGQISLGHGAFVTLGAYTSALLMARQDWPFWVTIIAAGVLAAIAGLLVGIPALRLSGPYLAIATLSLAIATPQIVKKYDDFTGGTQGIGRSDGLVQPGPPGFLSDLLNRDQWLYFVVLLTMLAMTLLAWFLLRGRIGRAFVAVRDAEVAAAAMGINVARTKVTAFAISAFYAGIAGALFVQVQGIMTPDSIGILQSITFLTSIVIGGLASILGSIIGAAFVVYLPSDITDLFKKLVGAIPGFSGETIRPGALQGAAVIIVMLLMPAGVAGFLIRLIRLRPVTVLQSVRSAPAGLRSGSAAALERLSSLWDSRPGRRGPPRPQSPEDKERG